VTQSPDERFWAKVDKHGPLPARQPSLGECWLWKAALTGAGYGKFRTSATRTVRAHRWSYERLVGVVPPATPDLDHLCEVPACVNPAHLRPTTPAKNVLRSLSAPPAINARKECCWKGHPFTEENTLLVQRSKCRTARACRLCARERKIRFDQKGR
jgi:hypothetical protein